jgi:WxL Interacting Protein, peptidoglycan binding domain/WxL Interacting Protein, host binding domain
MPSSFFLQRPGFFARLIMGVFLLITVIMSVSLVGTLGSSVAHADSGQANFALQPVLFDPSNPLTESYFIFDSKPGTVITSHVRVTNSGTAKGSASLYPVDATTGQTSGAVYLNQNDPRKDVGSWLRLGVQQVTLNPGQSQVVSYQITIPGTVRPGQHLGGIVAENLTQSSSPQSNSAIQIKVKNLTIVAVQVNLPGPAIEQLAGTGVQAGGEHSYQELLVGLSNTGTVMLKPEGTLQVTDAQGQVVKNMSLKLDTFLPQTAINYPVAITGKALNVGDYQATLTLTYGNGQVLHYSTKFTVTQQQLTQVFGTTSSKTQAPSGIGGTGGMQLWQIVLAAGGALALLWVAGSTLYKRIVVSRSKSATIHSSQFKRPMF